MYVHSINTNCNCFKRMNMEENQLCYAVVNNIPDAFHSSDLRTFFTDFVETGKFDCFHFRHRVQLKTKSSDSTATDRSTRCCIVRLTPENRTELIQTYSELHWTNDRQEILPLKCFITAVKLDPTDEASLIELKPPAIMPRGNVGTPTSYFLEEIKMCRMPPAVIKKLHLRFPRSSKRLYSSVPPPECLRAGRRKAFQQPTESEGPHGEHIAAEHPDSGNKSEEEEETEEWDRHNALWDNVTSQGRSKERLYEEDMEVTWEKGGPGLVFYTDEYFWRKVEAPDFEEETVDDWDVDTAGIYDGTGKGDKDANDFVEIRKARLVQEGKLNDSVFRQKKPKDQQQPGCSYNRKRNAADSDEEPMAYGHFEKFTKGIGRKVLESQGWQEGKGVGRHNHGRPVPVAVDLDSQMNTKGLGYKGVKLERFHLRRPPPQHLITTKYDSPKETDPGEELLQRNELTTNKHREKTVGTLKFLRSAADSS